MVAAANPKADDCLREPVVMVAQWIFHFAMLIYLYTVFGCILFTSQFFRQVAVIFQFIKLMIIFGGIFPCVLHSQAKTIFPSLSGTVDRMAVIGILIVINILLAFMLPRCIFSNFLEPVTKNFSSSTTKCQLCCEKPPKTCKKAPKMADSRYRRC